MKRPGSAVTPLRVVGTVVFTLVHGFERHVRNLGPRR
jgi:hypothetical protein